MALLNIRHCIAPGNPKERFLSLGVAKQIEELPFAMLNDRTNQKLPAVMKRIAMAFSYVRSMDEATAYEVFQKLWAISQTKDTVEKKDGDDLSRFEEVFEEVGGLLIYYAEYRKTAFKEARYQYIFEEAWEQKRNFNPRKFKVFLLDILKNGSLPIKKHFSWRFWQLTEKENEYFDRDFPVAVRYLKRLLLQYDNSIFQNVYYFIHDFIDSKYDACIKLWKKCINVERAYFLENKRPEKIESWWPCHYNNEILIKIAEHEGEAEFLHWLEKLCGYPKNLQIMGDMTAIFERLKQADNVQKVAPLIQSIVERKNEFYEDWKEWKRNVEIE